MSYAERAEQSPQGNVPNLRFPEFSREWECKKLGDIGTTLIGLTYSPQDVVPSDGTIVLRSSNIKGGLLDYTDLVRVNKKIKESIITRTNDILICARNGSARLIGKNAILKDSDCGHTFGAFMMVYRSEDNPFVHQLLSTKRYYSQVAENLGARINQITTSDLNSFEFSFPQSNKEKVKIASMLSLLDDRIATQIKIIEDLKKLKSAIRTKVFKQLESSCECWSEIGNMLQYEQPSKYLVASTEYSDSYATPVLTANKAFILGYTDEEFGIYSKGECVIFDDFTMDVKYVNFPFKVKSSAIKILTSNSGNDLYFVYEYLQNLGLVSEEHKRHYISEIEPMIVACPTFEEQQNISNLLRSFDRKIEYANRELTLYNKQKQYLLSQMFI